MDVRAVDTAAQVDVSQGLAMKVLKDQLLAQERLAAALMQPTMVYDANGGVRPAPAQSSFDARM